MNYYSHSTKLADGTYQGQKLIKEHVSGMMEKAKARFCELVELDFSKEELTFFLTVLIKLHDFGKYTSYFQDYLLKRGDIDFLLKQHARIGGLTAYNHFKNKDKKLAVAALYLIFMHHSQLTDLSDLNKKIDLNLKKIFQHQKDVVSEDLIAIEDELELKSLKTMLEFPDGQEIRKTIKIWVKKEADIRDYFFLNYLFSLLIEADKLDASGTSLYNPIPLISSSVDDRFGIPSVDITSPDLNTLDNNGLRNYCRAEVVKCLENPKILEHYLFTLTAPTGIGKTMTALDFALKFKKKLEDHFDYQTSIIYALPFINIIEQAINEYEKTLPSNSRILGHYQLADVFGKEKREDEESNDKTNYHQKLMAIDTWQGDVVITSFVQFFETLISNRNKLLKKFNHFAGAIIILDEV